jgi:hypothetical protein
MKPDPEDFVEYIDSKREGTMAIIVRSEYSRPGIRFFTENDLAQQLGYIEHPKDHEIQPHIHNCIPRKVNYTQEILFIRKGQLQVDFYTSSRAWYCSRSLSAGDVLMLIKGGHGFKCLTDVQLFEVKNGPYIDPETDKIKFSKRSAMV